MTSLISNHDVLLLLAQYTKKIYYFLYFAPVPLIKTKKINTHPRVKARSTNFQNR